VSSQSYKRKLAAILSADVKGYSRLMSEDEAHTIGTLTEYREIMSSFIQKKHGRVVDSPGDNLLAEFASVINAVQCALEIQEELKARNADLSETRRMEFRIGVNLGDVVEEDERIYGDGVNIAARLENLAEAGGICISGSVYKQVKNKLALGYEYLGERSVKNIAEPINVYRVLMEPDAAGKVISEKRAWLKGGQWVANPPFLWRIERPLPCCRLKTSVAIKSRSISATASPMISSRTYQNSENCWSSPAIRFSPTRVSQ
jgi:adenylate cyclase